MAEAPFVEIQQEWHWRPDTGIITEQTPLADYLTDLRQWILEARPPTIQLVFKDRCDIYKVIPVPDDEIIDFDIKQGVGPASLELSMWSLLPNIRGQSEEFRNSVSNICQVILPPVIPQTATLAPDIGPDLLKILGKVNFSS